MDFPVFNVIRTVFRPAFLQPGFLPEDAVTMFAYPVSGHRETDDVVFVTGNGVAVRGRAGKTQGQ